MSMLDLMTDEECMVAEAFFGFCWWCGARDDQSPDDPAHSLYEALMSGTVADDPGRLLSFSKHAELGSSSTLAVEVLGHDKTRLSEYVASVDEEWKRWRPGADVDTHLPAFVARATDSTDTKERLAAARGLVYEAFHFGARAAAVSGGKNDSGFGLIYRTAEHMVRSFEEARFPITFEELKSVISSAASSAPGASGVFVVIPFVDEEDPRNLSGVRDSAMQMVTWLAHESPFQLTSHVLDDRDLVTQVARRLKLRPGMASNGVIVAIPLVDPDNPNNIAGVQRNAGRLVEFFTGQSAPVGIVDEPELVERIGDYLASRVTSGSGASLPPPQAPPASSRGAAPAYEPVASNEGPRRRRWFGR